MIKLSQEQIIEAIRPAGLHNAKSKNILATSYKLLMEYNGKVPQTQKKQKNNLWSCPELVVKLTS